jgi:transcriptional/translational regulatory protein YebC/TACO1
MFSRVGEITFARKAGSPEAVLEAGIEVGADDVMSDDEGHVIYCAADSMSEVAGKLAQTLGEPSASKVVWKPNSTTPLEEERAEQLVKLVTSLDEEDDVQNVYSNFEVSSEVLNKLTAA